MDVPDRGARGSTAAGAVALVLAAAGAASVALGSAVWARRDGDETMTTLALILGWVLLAWAAIIALVVLVRAFRAVLRRRRPALPSVLLVLAALTVLGVTGFAVPLVGAGSGIG